MSIKIIREEFLENIFIYEKKKIIFASKGKIIKDDKLSYLELTGGILQEKDNDKINNIKFEKMTFDFLSLKVYQLRILNSLKEIYFGY